MHTDVTVRAVKPGDLPAVTALCGQLGYQTNEREVGQRIRRLSGRADNAVFVAVRDDRVVGWIHLQVRESVESSPDVEVGGLVVDEAHRGSGIGRLLMAHADRWAADRGCTQVRLRSNVVRGAAHAFYQRLGFRIQKTQYTFVKALAGTIAGA